MLEDLIAAEGHHNTTRLHIRPGLSLVELADEPGAETPVVKRNEPFMIEVAAGKHGHMLVLNNAGGLWGIVPFADGSHESKVAPGSVVIPGIRDYKFACITERSVTGPHRIIVFVSKEPLGDVIADYHRSGAALNWQGLNELASRFSKVPKHLREIHVLKFTVV